MAGVKKGGQMLEEISITYDGQTCGTINLATLPSFRLFCEEQGLRFRWDPKQFQVHVQSGLAGKICVLRWREGPFPDENDVRSLEREMLLQIQQSLAQSGVGVVFASGLLSPPKGWIVQIGVERKESLPEPQVILSYADRNNNGSHEKLVRNLAQELKTAYVKYSEVQGLADDKPAMLIEIACLLPEPMDISTCRPWARRCALALATGLLRFYLAEDNIPALSCFKTGIQNIVAAPHRPSKSNEPETSIREPAGQEKTRETLPVQDSVQVREPNDLQQNLQRQKEKVAAEVFFDYTVIRSELAHQPFIIVGNLYIKNTGVEVLTNPVVGLRTAPAENVRLSGQILPTQFVDTMAVQSSEGIRGWRFLEEDELKSEQYRGEYWMTPIHPVRIAPQTVYPLPFQLTVQANDRSSRRVTVEGSVYFRDHQQHVSANNRIALAY